VNSLVGGYDAEGPSLYWLDYMGTMQKVTKGAHGYGSYFLLSVMDNKYKENFSFEDGIETIKACIHELKTRFLISQSNFVVKVATKDGIKTINLDEKKH